VTSDSKHLITALQNILSKLELTEAPGCDEESFAELKLILKQRILDLENCAAISGSTSRAARIANNSD
jgi:hypothetical protein